MVAVVEMEDEVVGTGIEQGGVVARVQLANVGAELEQRWAPGRLSST
ncbi:MAG: hypothetical protein R2725_13950 [Solirubrobacterales bacterium]